LKQISDGSIKSGKNLGDLTWNGPLVILFSSKKNNFARTPSVPMIQIIRFKINPGSASVFSGPWKFSGKFLKC